MADAWAEFDALKKDEIDTGKVGSAQFFGTAADLKATICTAWRVRCSASTAIPPPRPSIRISRTTRRAQPLTGAANYTYHFASGQLPPVNAFWSLTMYELPQSLLVANPINRYLINSPMVPGLIKDPDGGYTLYLQNESPGPHKKANWLPAPKGPFQWSFGCTGRNPMR